MSDARQWWLGSPNIPTSPYLVKAHQDLARADMTKLGQAGMTVRVVFNIGEIDTSPSPSNPDGVIDSWALPDALMKTAAQTGTKVLPVLYSTAVVPDTKAKRATFAKASAAIIARYKAGSAFWQANPTLVPKPFETAEIWNEPNRTEYFPATAKDYGCLVGQVWQATQSLVPGFKFISGGLAETSSNGQTPGYWLFDALLYSWWEVTGPVPSSSNFFALKGIGFHPYGAPSYSNWLQAAYNTMDLKAAMDDLVRRTNSSVYPPPVWVTEMGWRVSATPNGATTFGEVYVADMYANYLAWFSQWSMGGWGEVGGVFAYNLRNQNAGSPLDDGFGLFRTTGTLYATDTTQADAGPPHNPWGVMRKFTSDPPNYTGGSF